MLESDIIRNTVSYPVSKTGLKPTLSLKTEGEISKVMDNPIVKLKYYLRSVVSIIQI